MAVEVLRFRRLPEGNIQCLRDVQLPGLAICAQTAVVVDAVGDVGVLLDLCHHDALADGVQRAGGDEEAVPLVHRHGVQHVGQGVILNAALKLLLADLMGEAVVEGGTRLCFQHIPHLGLAVLVLVLQSVFIGGVHLNGQVFFGINELCQNGELAELFAVGAKAAGMSVDVLLEGGAVRQVAGAVRVAGQHPRLAQGV